MGKNIFLLSPLNLALDGSLDLFGELYRATYDRYYETIKEHPNLINDTTRLDAIIIPQLVPAYELLAFRRLRIFTKRIKNIHLNINHFKYFRFVDEEKVKWFKRRLEWEIAWAKKNESKYGKKSTLYATTQAEDVRLLSEFQEVVLDFDQFIDEFQRIVTRAIREAIQKDDPTYSIFDARKDVEAHITQRMMQKQNECIIPKATNSPPTSEPLYIFDALNNLSCKQNRHRIVIRKYYVLHADGEHTVVLPVHYCEECNRYMIGRLSLACFREFCGNFIVQTHMLSSDGNSEWNILRESKLHQLGYNVVEGNMTAFERQNLLVTLLKGKYISFFEIVSTIEQNIRMFKSHYKMQNAVQKWRDDLKFINEYAASK